MDAIPKLIEHQVQAWTDSRSYARGRDYFQDNRILHSSRAGTTLYGQCLGSASEPYYVEATLAENGIAWATCSCPVGTDGHCKHVVALLLTWLYRAEAFGDIALLERSLNQRSKEELVKLILKLVRRNPDLEPLVQMPLPGRGQDRPAVDAAQVRRQTRLIIDRMPHEWGASYAAAAKLGRIVSEGDGYASAGDWDDAAVVYATVTQEVLDNYDTLYEEEGEFLEQVGECVRGLAECLDHVEGGEQRHAIIQSLFAVVHWDITFGGVGLKEDAVTALIDETTAEERAQMAIWGRQLLPQLSEAQDSFAKTWRQQAFGEFLLQLEQDTLDDEAYLALCRQAGRSRDAVGRLLRLERVEEAIAEARQASDYDLITLSSDIRNAGHAHLAENLLAERRPHTKDARVLEHLLVWVQERNDTALALDVARQLFQMREQLETYQRLREAAQAAGRWPVSQAQVMDQLAAEHQYALLIQIHLDEGRVDDAVHLLRIEVHTPTSGFFSGRIPTSLALEVAKAAETTRPEAAIDIYLSAAQHAINLRGRDNYNLAARYLSPVRDLLQGSGQQERWRTIISRIRNEYKRLPALQDELTSAGL